jgi:hypothetical protein
MRSNLFAYGDSPESAKCDVLAFAKKLTVVVTIVLHKSILV